MLKKNLKFMAIIMTMLLGWMIWVIISVSIDEYNTKKDKAYNEAYLYNRDQIVKVVEKYGKEKGEVRDYTINAEEFREHYGSREAHATVYIYYTTETGKETGNWMDIVNVDTMFTIDYGVLGTISSEYVE